MLRYMVKREKERERDMCGDICGELSIELFCIEIQWILENFCL